MSNKTLEELQAEIAASEAEDNQSPVDELETDDKANEEDDSELDDLGEGDDEDDESESLEWLRQSDEQTSQESVPLSKHIAVRQKLKDKAHSLEDENAELKKEIERLHQSQSQLKPKPKREDFYDHDDPDEAYTEALTDWKLEQNSVQSQSKELQRKQQEIVERQQQKVAKDVDEHWKRAESFISKHNISQEVYAKAENNFRDTVKAVAGEESGDGITNSIISVVGEGSEKLMMFVGNNAARREQLQSALVSDPSGLKAVLMLGKWQAEIDSPKKRVSQAPKPPSTAKGDAVITQSESKLMKRYQKAMKDGDGQTVFNLRQEARKAGYNIKNW